MAASVRIWVGAIVVAAWLPSPASAQPVARTIAELQGILKPGDYVIVVGGADRETWGRLVDLSPAGLTVAPAVKAGDRIVTTAERRSFAAGDISVVFRSDYTGARRAGVYPASWQALEALPPGSELTVVLASGERREYRSGGLTADSLRLLTPAGQQELIGKAAVLRVERRGVHDPVGDGIVIGALAGAGTGFGLMAAAYNSCRAGCDAPAPGPMYLGAIGMGAGVGAVVGWIVDRAHTGKSVVFPTVAPVVARDRKALVFSVRF